MESLEDFFFKQVDIARRISKSMSSIPFLSMSLLQTVEKLLFIGCETYDKSVIDELLVKSIPSLIKNDFFTFSIGTSPSSEGSFESQRSFFLHK